MKKGSGNRVKRDEGSPGGLLFLCDIGKCSYITKKLRKDAHSHMGKYVSRADRVRRAKWNKSLVREEFRELKWTCPLCF